MPAHSALRRNARHLQEVAAQLREANALDWRLYVLARALLERQEAACAAEAAATNKGR